MNRDQALEELKLRLTDTHVLTRSLIVEAMMQELAMHFNADTQLWGMAGLLHDIDFQKTIDQPDMHGVLGAEILENLNVDSSIVYSVKAHNNSNNIPRKRKLDKSLYLCDYIAEVALSYYNSNLPDIKEKTEEVVLKHIDVENLTPEIDEIGLSTRDLIKLALKVMETII